MALSHRLISGRRWNRTVRFLSWACTCAGVAEEALKRVPTRSPVILAAVLVLAQHLTEYARSVVRTLFHCSEQLSSDSGFWALQDAMITDSLAKRRHPHRSIEDTPKRVQHVDQKTRSVRAWHVPRSPVSKPYRKPFAGRIENLDHRQTSCQTTKPRFRTKASHGPEDPSRAVWKLECQDCDIGRGSVQRSGEARSDRAPQLGHFQQRLFLFRARLENRFQRLGR